MYLKIITLSTCEPVCPVEVISFEADTPAQWRVFQSVNAEFFADLGSPGGASAVGKIRKDHPIAAGLPAAIGRPGPAAANR